MTTAFKKHGRFALSGSLVTVRRVTDRGDIIIRPVANWPRLAPGQTVEARGVEMTVRKVAATEIVLRPTGKATEPPPVPEREAVLAERRAVTAEEAAA